MKLNNNNVPLVDIHGTNQQNHKKPLSFLGRIGTDSAHMNPQITTVAPTSARRLLTTTPHSRATKSKSGCIATLLLTFCLFLAARTGATTEQEQNNGKHLEELRVKAEQGDAAAQSDLGLCYYEGTGIPKDFAEAVKWFHKSAEQGYAEAQHNLAQCYFQGDGLAKDDAESTRWDRKAAEQGYDLNGA
jgi:hypothetical protein